MLFGRQNLDAALIGNECIDSDIKPENSGILCELDIERLTTMSLVVFFSRFLKKWGFLVSGGIGSLFAFLLFASLS